VVTTVCVTACLSVCLSARRRIPTLLHGPGCNLGNGRGCPLAVHYWADLQSVHGFSCYDNIAPNAKCQRVLVLTLCLASSCDDLAHVAIFTMNCYLCSFTDLKLSRFIKSKPRTERVQALADISRSRYVVSNESRAPIANPPNSAQLGGTPAILPSYILVRAVVWVCGRGQADTQTSE